MVTLLEHQLDALKYLKDLDKCALFIKAGQGKTYIALEKFKDLKNVLIITTCKDYNEGRWITEAEKYGFKGTIEVINYEKLRNKKVFNMYYKNKYDGLIVDECHHFKKNTRSKDSGNIRKLSKKIKNVIGLTGTHSPNNFKETFNILRNLDCNPFEICSEDEFLETYYKCRRILTPYGSLNIPSDIRKDKEPELLEKLNEVSYIYFPDDPHYINNEIIIDEELDPMYSEVMKGIFCQETISVLVKIKKLEQLANGFYFNNKKSPIYLDDYKINKLEEVLLENKDDDFIIVYKFIPDKHKILKLLERLKLKAMVLQSSQSEAMNLQEYNHIIFYSPSYSNKDFEQMKARIMRHGQLRTPQFTTLIRKNTIEEYILTVLDKKQKNTDKLSGFNKWMNLNNGINIEIEGLL